MPALKKIVVKDFRNIEFQELAFSPNVNCISGNNGEGKTNLVDAIYYLSMTKSAFPAPDRYNFRYGTEGFTLGGSYAMENGAPEVKARADHIAPSNAEDGVAQVVERFIRDGQIGGGA